MEISGLNGGMSVQGTNTFGTLNTDKDDQNTIGAAGDQVEISDEAMEMYALMQASGQDTSEMSPEEMEKMLAENPEAAAMMQANAGQQAQAAPSNGTQGGKGGGKGGGGGGGSSASVESTSSETSLEAEILELEMKIAQAEEEAEESGNTAEVEALEAELEELETELDELTEA